VVDDNSNSVPFAVNNSKFLPHESDSDISSQDKTKSKSESMDTEEVVEIVTSPAIQAIQAPSQPLQAPPLPALPALPPPPQPLNALLNTTLITSIIGSTNNGTSSNITTITIPSNGYQQTFPSVTTSSGVLPLDFIQQQVTSNLAFAQSTNTTFYQTTVDPTANSTPAYTTYTTYTATSRTNVSNNKEIEDDKKILNNITFTIRQRRVLEYTFNLLKNHRLFQSIHKSFAVLERKKEKDAMKLRSLFDEHQWDQKLIKFLHDIIREHLSDYYDIYLEVLKKMVRLMRTERVYKLSGLDPANIWNEDKIVSMKEQTDIMNTDQLLKIE